MDRATRWLADWLADDWRRQSAIALNDERHRYIQTVGYLHRYKARNWRAAHARACKRTREAWEVYQTIPQGKLRLTGWAKDERDEFVVTWIRLAGFDLRADMIEALALALGISQHTVEGIWKCGTNRMRPRICSSCFGPILRDKKNKRGALPRDKYGYLICSNCQ